jgi:hypothetical protein
MKRYRIQRKKNPIVQFFVGPEYLCTFDFKDELDWRPEEGSAFSRFLIFNDASLPKAQELAELHGGVVVELTAYEYSTLERMRNEHNT